MSESLCFSCSAMEPRAANVLFLYNATWTLISTVTEYLNAFSTLSRHRFLFAHSSPQGEPCSLDEFDAVAVHYSVRLVLSGAISPAYLEQLGRFRGPKLLFLQEEYDEAEANRKWIERLGFDLVFTCVPPAEIEKVYPKSRFPKTRFVSILTGYVPPRFERGAARKPIAARKITLAYRGRTLPYRYGKLGHEKLEIGKRMKEICLARGIPVDIDWRDENRIYGDGWYEFLASAKATLGSESGSSVWDDDGEIRRTIERALVEDPALTFEAAEQRFLAPHEGKVRMNQVSPKIFEAIGLGTGLVLYEGEWSGVVEPERHYLPLAKDFRNVDHVLAALADDARIQAMADRAFNDVIASGRWSYRTLVETVEAALNPLLGERRAAEPFLVALPHAFPRRIRLEQVPTSAPLAAAQCSVEVGYVPAWLQLLRRIWRTRLMRAIRRE